MVRGRHGNRFIRENQWVKKMKIAVDAMGGEYAPQAIVAGTIQAAEKSKAELILVGNKKAIEKELRKYRKFPAIRPARLLKCMIPLQFQSAGKRILPLLNQ